MSTHNKGFYEDLTKLSFNYHQICTLSFLLSGGGGGVQLQTRVGPASDRDVSDTALSFEPRHEKTNLLVSDLVRHKPGCTATEDA